MHPIGYSEVWKNLEYNGNGLLNYITAPTLEGIEKESSYKEFYSDLSKIKCPVWIFREPIQKPIFRPI